MIKSKTIVSAAEAAVCGIIIFLIAFFDVFGYIDDRVCDLLYQQPRGVNHHIKMIGIDDSEESLEMLGNSSEWQRDVYAQIIEKLGDQPELIVLDILLLGSRSEDGDTRFTEACRNSDRIISAEYIDYSTEYIPTGEGVGYVDPYYINSVQKPINSGYSALGFVNTDIGADGMVRSVRLTDEYEGEELQSLAYRTYTEYCKKEGIQPSEPLLDHEGRFWIDYAGKPYDYECVPVWAFLSGKVDPRAFKDCIVFIGGYAASLRDEFSVPNSGDQMFGVEINANILQALMDNRDVVPADKTLLTAVSVIVCLAVFVFTRKVRFRINTPIVAVLTAGWFVLCVLLWRSGVMVQAVYVPLAAILSYLVNLGIKYAEEAIEKHKITTAFKKYVAPQVVEEIAKSGKYHIKLGGEKRDIAVLFVDIRGFTTLSENLETEKVVDIINRYLNLTTNAIFANGGTLDKFIGDATMAVFNSPFDLDDYVFRAVKTAKDIVDGGAAIEHEFMEKYGRSVAFGVGVNCGEAVVGNIGCDFRMDYTAIGDTVNTASRLESNAKRGQILISEAVYERVKDRITAEAIGEIPLKGKSKGVFVYSLVSINVSEGNKDEK